MSGPRRRGLLPVAALTTGALACWLAGASAGALSAQTGATRAELSATAVVRTSVAAGTWDAEPAQRSTSSATQRPARTAALAPDPTSPTGTPTGSPADQPVPVETASAPPTAPTDAPSTSS